MNLPNDVARCVGRLDFGHGPESICPYRDSCIRHTQLEADRNSKCLPDPAYMRVPMMMHCYVDGVPTMRVEG